MIEWLRELFIPYPAYRKGLVNLKSGSALRGIIWRRRRGYVILRQAALLRPRESPVAMDGEVMIYREDVDFIQVVG